jgi:hypothetical protein
LGFSSDGGKRFALGFEAGIEFVQSRFRDTTFDLGTDSLFTVLTI